MLIAHIVFHLFYKPVIQGFYILKFFHSQQDNHRLEFLPIAEHSSFPPSCQNPLILQGLCSFSWVRKYELSRPPTRDYLLLFLLCRIHMVLSKKRSNRKTNISCPFHSSLQIIVVLHFSYTSLLLLTPFLSINHCGHPCPTYLFYLLS